MLKIRLLILMLVVFCVSNYAQDQHFSQFTNMPLFVNPANTGFFIGDWRAGMAYRNQWRSIDIPFETYAIFADKKFQLDNDRVGVGIMLMNDRSGPAGLNFTKAYLSGAYSKIQDGHGLTLGFQPGIIHNFVSNEVTFPDQYNPETGEFESTILTLEDLGKLRKTYFDMNIGILWNYRASKWSAYTGLSVAHITQPNESFIDAVDAVLPRKMIVHSAFAIKLSDFISLSPSVLYARHNRATEFLFGSWVDFAVGHESYRMGVKFGLNYRNNTRSYASAGFTNKSDAINVMAGYRMQDFDLSFSYDINISSLDIASQNRGAFEFTLLYFHGSANDDFGKDIPCWRY